MMNEILTEQYGSTTTPEEVGEVLGQHPSHVRHMCADGSLPAVKIGHRWHVVTARFAEMLEGRDA